MDPIWIPVRGWAPKHPLGDLGVKFLDMGKGKVMLTHEPHPLPRPFFT